MQFYLTFIILLSAISDISSVCNQKSITITANNFKFEAILCNTKTVNELLIQFPLTITMSELNHNEKYFFFPKQFTTSPEKLTQIETGDWMLYQNNYFVIFYESFSTTYSYTRLGRIKNVSDWKSALGETSVSVAIAVKDFSGSEYCGFCGNNNENDINNDNNNDDGNNNWNDNSYLGMRIIGLFYCLLLFL